MHKDSVSTLLALSIDTPSILACDDSGRALRVVLADLGGTPDGIQVDARNGLIYWTNMGEDYQCDDGTVEVARLDGSERRLLVGCGAITTPKQLYLDQKRDYLYWCDREGAAVWRADCNGEVLSKLVDRTGEPGGRENPCNQCVGITVDHRRHQFLWTQKGPPKGGEGRIFRAAQQMPPGQHAANRSDIELLAENLPEPIDLELDEEGDWLYWTDRGAPPDGNSLNRARLTDAGLGEPEVICSGFAEAIGLALDLPYQRAFVSDLDGQLFAVDLLSGNKKLIAKLGRLTGLVLMPGA